MMLRLAPLLLLLAGCDEQSIRPETNQMPASQGRAKPAPAAAPFSIEEKTAVYEFNFSWPAEAAAIPRLVRYLQAQMEKSKRELAGNAEKDKAFHDREKLEFHPHGWSTAYETAGQSSRLLSLRVDSGGYTGGAHGNYGTAVHIWDRQARREVKFADLFAQPANRDRLLTQRWCDAIDKARAEKRDEPLGEGMFDDCPGLDDIAIIPADTDKDGRFERLVLIASPYVAGPYSEGSYEIELPMTPDLIAGLKVEYQPSFAA